MGFSFPMLSPRPPHPPHPLNLDGADMWGRLQNPTPNVAEGGIEAVGCTRFPNELAYAVEKTRKPIKTEKNVRES